MPIRRKLVVREFDGEKVYLIFESLSITRYEHRATDTHNAWVIETNAQANSGTHTHTQKVKEEGKNIQPKLSK